MNRLVCTLSVALLLPGIAEKARLVQVWRWDDAVDVRDLWRGKPGVEVGRIVILPPPDPKGGGGCSGTTFQCVELPLMAPLSGICTPATSTYIREKSRWWTNTRSSLGHS